MKMMWYLQKSMFNLFLFVIIGVISLKAQPANLFSDESCIKTNNIADCYNVIHWNQSSIDTVFITSKDSVIAIYDLSGKDVFFLNYLYRSGFIALELICRNDSNTIENLPLMERSISEENWEAVSLDQQRWSKANYGIGMSERNQLPQSWFKLNSKKEDKSLVIVIVNTANVDSHNSLETNKSCILSAPSVKKATL